MKEKRKNEEQAITLIALVITIIVLLILAGVTIATLTGQNGILTQASKSNVETRAGKVEEEVNLWKMQINANNYTTWGTEDENAMLARLKKDGSVLEQEIDPNNRTITIGDRVISYKVDVPEGKLVLEYQVDGSLLFLIPKISGYVGYNEYAQNILKGKTNEEKISIFLEGESESIGRNFQNLSEWIEYFNSETGSHITQENFEEDIVNKVKEWEQPCSSFDEVMILWHTVKYKAYTEKYDKYSDGSYYINIKRDDVQIADSIELNNAYPTDIKAGTYTYTAIAQKDGQEASVTLTFKKEDLPRYVIELRSNYIFRVYDHQEEKYLTFSTAQLTLKKNGVEVFNQDVTNNINKYGVESNSNIYMREDLENKDFNLFEKTEAKLIVDGTEIQNVVCMPPWME